jgi:hypothetical protein
VPANRGRHQAQNAAPADHEGHARILLRHEHCCSDGDRQSQGDRLDSPRLAPGGEERRTAQQGGDSYLVHSKELRRFLLHHPDEYELGPIEKFFFLDILSDHRLCEDYRKEIA